MMKVYDLDPGIRRVVELLIANGFETCDSGDGVSKEPGEERRLVAGLVRAMRPGGSP